MGIETDYLSEADKIIYKEKIIYNTKYAMERSLASINKLGVKEQTYNILLSAKQNEAAAAWDSLVEVNSYINVTKHAVSVAYSTIDSINEVCFFTIFVAEPVRNYRMYF